MMPGVTSPYSFTMEVLKMKKKIKWGDNQLSRGWHDVNYNYEQFGILYFIL